MIEKVSEFKDRLNEALFAKGIRPVDLSRKTGISEATISQYRSGYAKPKEDNVAKIADALKVNPTWLMGLNVPADVKKRPIYDIEIELSDNERLLVERIREADPKLRRIILSTLNIFDDEEDDNGKSN